MGESGRLADAVEKQIEEEHQKGRQGLVGWEKEENDSGRIRHSGSYHMQLMAEELLSREEQELLAKTRDLESKIPQE